VQIDAPVPHGFRQQSTGFVVKAFQDLRATMVHRHLHSKARHNAGEFTGDIATADDQQRFRQVFQQEHVVRHKAQMAVLYLWACRVAAGGDQDVLGRDGFAVPQLDRMRVNHGSAAVVDFDVGSVQ
jgi:hypothetical protein